LYVKVLSISVVFNGPPPVVIQMRANCWVVQMKSSRAMLMTIGRSCGRVMNTNRCRGLAPSTLAASKRSVGIPWRPASRLVM